jgi:hypothetical protein
LVDFWALGILFWIFLCNLLYGNVFLVSNTLVVESCPVEIRPLFENPGNLKPGQNKPGQIIKFTQIWILEEELDSDKDVHVDLVLPLLETHEIN